MTTLGLVLLGVAWIGLPLLGTVGLPPFTMHMSQHMILVALAAPAFAVALARSRLDPVRRAPWATHAIVASMVELVAVWAWHAPALHRFARASPIGRVLEQATFLACGIYLWVAAFGGGAAIRRERAAAGITGLLLTSMHMTLLGALLTLGSRPLFQHHGPAGWLSPIHDQQLGGAIMLVVGAAAYLAGGLVLAARTLGADEPEAVR